MPTCASSPPCSSTSTKRSRPAACGAISTFGSTCSASRCRRCASARGRAGAGGTHLRRGGRTARPRASRLLDGSARGALPALVPGQRARAAQRDRAALRDARRCRSRWASSELSERIRVADAQSAGSYAEAVRAFKGSLVRDALARSGGSRSNAARALGLHPSNLIRMIRELGIDVPAPPRGADARPGSGLVRAHDMSEHEPVEAHGRRGSSALLEDARGLRAADRRRCARVQEPAARDQRSHRAGPESHGPRAFGAPRSRGDPPRDGPGRRAHAPPLRSRAEAELAAPARRPRTRCCARSSGCSDACSARRSRCAWS